MGTASYLLDDAVLQSVQSLSVHQTIQTLSLQVQELRNGPRLTHFSLRKGLEAKITQSSLVTLPL